MTAIIVIVLVSAIGVYGTYRAIKNATWIDDENFDL